MVTRFDFEPLRCLATTDTAGFGNLLSPFASTRRVSVTSHNPWVPAIGLEFCSSCLRFLHICLVAELHKQLDISSRNHRVSPSLPLCLSSAWLGDGVFCARTSEAIFDDLTPADLEAWSHWSNNTLSMRTFFGAAPKLHVTGF